jgi:methyl-accepting chemotaxis protein
LLIQQSNADVAHEMETAKARVVNTSEMAQEAGGVLDQVVDHSNTIADMVRGIATAAEEQSATSDEINNSVTHINDLSQEVLSGIRESNRGIQDVSEMAQHLSELVSKFRN